ncbi:metallophosphoesterase [Nakamurella sp. A5-74]|uniref:Metallophosphoesterase n=1 Tax=Nakamurella sp. A5-74 TaxID=3158264 RepID=A0AAU8DT31_9ACTN
MSNDIADLSRRRLLISAGVVAAGAAVGGAQAAEASPPSGRTGAVDPDGRRDSAAGRGPQQQVNGLHLQFGHDASRQVVVSWHTLTPVSGARAVIGRPDGEFLASAKATTRSYLDQQGGVTVYAHHARFDRLAPGTDYLYAALHAGAAPQFGQFSTVPRGRTRVTFTSFGDQGTPTLGKLFQPPVGVTLPRIPWVNDNLGSPSAGDTTAGVEQVAPMFHLFNGDLCYANLAQDRVRTWFDFWENNSRSARNRPWMPSAGNHENERGNGPIGYRAYQTYFELPAADRQTDVTRGLWYSFTAGAVRVISLANDDVCLQDGGDSYVHDYSGGAQKRWLERELAAARADRDIDWIVVCMHQVAISTANNFNGADLGVRQEWLPLFDRYGVDLVVCGHEHHYERSHPLRGHADTRTLTPTPVSTATHSVDTSRGTVHMVLGGGGTSAPSNQLLSSPPECRVIVSVGDPDPTTGKRPPVYVREQAPWSAVRDAANAYGFAGFEVDPGRRGGETTMKVTYYNVTGVGGGLEVFETFTLRRPRRDG